MLILGIILLVVGYILPLPLLTTIGWILIVIGLILLLLSVFGVGVGGARVGASGRRFWF